MGKGGQQAESNVSLRPKQAWESPYKPLDKDAPKLPSKSEVKAVIPPHCFEKSYAWSFFYLARDLAMASAFAYATSLVLSTEVPSGNLAIALWTFGWGFYAFWMGTILTGLWVLAHECGHGAFSPNQFLNDCVGYVLHQALLVPYLSWQYTHAKHHRRTNHLTDGESHVPCSPYEMGIREQGRLTISLSNFHYVAGQSVMAISFIFVVLAFGWPTYLLGFLSTGRVAADGSPLGHRFMDHFRPNSPMFPPNMFYKALFSTMSQLAVIGGLCYLKYVYGVLPVVLWYWGPYMIVNAWLVGYTWLQHTDPSIPHYGDSDWTWMKGALSTIDRDYGIFDFFHHRIGSTHVVHHLFHEMPWHHAAEATAAVKAFLEPKGLYNFDPTPIPLVLWKVSAYCHYIEEEDGTQYYQTFGPDDDFKMRKKDK